MNTTDLATFLHKHFDFEHRDLDYSLLCDLIFLEDAYKKAKNDTHKPFVLKLDFLNGDVDVSVHCENDHKEKELFHTLHDTIFWLEHLERQENAPKLQDFLDLQRCKRQKERQQRLLN